jgi:DNA repair exonuclease SbcCD ATPase subunit
LKKIEQFQITSMSISGFKSYEKPTELTFGNPTVITGGNGRGKTSIADAIAFAVTGLPFFGERGLDRLHNEKNPDVAIQMRFVDENGIIHELTRIRQKNDMSIYYDGHTIRQLDLADLFGERDVFLSILNPLYFIEELGTNGKNLLERYLPFIPQETILAQLPGAVQASLKDEVILSPDAYLKGRRAEIRELEERITYLSGQKDLAATQKKQHETMRVEISEGITALQNEIVALAEKQFAGLDTAEMQERLVELSQRYDEMARDERGDTVQQQKELRALREKIVRRQSEQYQSKFTEPLAEIAAKVNDLGTRYKRESVAYKAFHAGMDCPTCHRRVTEETLPEVQAALKKNISELYAAGTEQKGQLTELQEMDKKARDTFDAFKEADLRKWTEDAAELERRCAEQSETSSQAAESLRSEIQALTAELEYGNLTQAEYGRLRECREQCRELESKLSALNEMASAQTPDFDREIREAQEAIGKIKRTMTNVISYVSKRAELTFSQLKMNRVEISLYDVVKSTGEVKDTFKFTYSGRRYDRLSLSEKIRAGMELSELIKRLTGRNYPVFVDNMESVDDLANVRPTGQIIMAKCVSNAPLQVRPIKPIVFAEQRAA